jgi:hypothetical protein
VEVEVVDSTAWAIEVDTQTLKRVMWRTASAVELWPDLAVLFDGDLVKLRCEEIDAAVLVVARKEKLGWKFAALRCPYARHNAVQRAPGHAYGYDQTACPLCADTGWMEASNESFGMVVEIACAVGRLRDLAFGLPTSDEIGLQPGAITAMKGIASAIGAPAPAVVPTGGVVSDHAAPPALFSPEEKRR